MMALRAAELLIKMIRKAAIMSVSETMALTLLVTGGLSLYIIVHAAVDLFRHGLREREDP